MTTGIVQGASLTILAGIEIARNVTNPSHGMVVGVEEEGVGVALEGEEEVIEAEVVIGEGVGEEVEEAVVVLWLTSPLGLLAPSRTACITSSVSCASCGGRWYWLSLQFNKT